MHRTDFGIAVFSRLARLFKATRAFLTLWFFRYIVGCNEIRSSHIILARIGRNVSGCGGLILNVEDRV